MSQTPSTQDFSGAAAYYDMLAGGSKRIEREAPLLEACLHAAPGCRVADIACGTGLHAHFLAESGAEVTALDASPAMIAYAQTHRSHPSLTYGVADMRFLCGGPWDLILCLGNSLSLLPSPGDLASTFQGVAAALAPGGIFLAQILNYTAAPTHEPRHRVERHRVGGETITAVKSLVPDGGHTLLSIVFHIAHDGGMRAITDTAVLRHWASGDLSGAAQSAGLTPAATYGAFDRSLFDPAVSPDLIMTFANRRVA